MNAPRKAEDAVLVPEPAAHWVRGNLHTHTTVSDGDADPSDVARWYRSAGYGFLSITDHNVLTDITLLQKQLDWEHERLGIPALTLLGGEEVTDEWRGDRTHPVHVNAIGCRGVVSPVGGESVATVLRNVVAAIRADGGIPIVNHPNFKWSLTLSDLLSIEEPYFLEIFNGHPATNTAGSLGSPSAEEMWDALLTAGRNVMAVATDDAHNYRQFHANLANPGRGWVSCEASHGTASAFLDALRSGSFYASTGVELEAVRRDGDTLTVSVRENADQRFVVTYIGEHGRVIRESTAMVSSCLIPTGETYLRARVRSSSGTSAWTQPHWSTPL